MSLQYVRDSKRQLYISKEVYAMLRIVAKAQGATPDEVADDELRGLITTRFPDVENHIKNADKLEEKLIEKLGQPKS